MFQSFLVRSLARRVSLVAPAPRLFPITARSIFTQNALLYPTAKATTPSTSKASKATTKGRTTGVKAASTKLEAAPKKKTPAKKTLAKPKKAVKKKPADKLKAKTRARKAVVEKKPAVKEYTPPPRKPLPVFFRWCIETQTNGPISPGDTLTARTRRYAEEWKNVPDSVKQIYHDKYANEVREWQAAHEAWQSSLSPKGRTQYRKDLRLRTKRRALRDVETGEIIRRLPSAFNIYFQETYPALKKSHPEQKHSERFTMTAKSWSTLAESEKAVYAARAAELRPAYLEAREKAKKKRIDDAVAKNPLLSST